MKFIGARTRIGLAFLVGTVSALLSGCAGGGSLASLEQGRNSSALQIITPSLQEGTSGQAFNQKLEVSGGTPPYNWNVTSGKLPSGLTLDGSTGTITGTPDTAGDYSFTVQVKEGRLWLATPRRNFPCGSVRTRRGLLPAACRKPKSAGLTRLRSLRQAGLHPMVGVWFPARCRPA